MTSILPSAYSPWRTDVRNPKAQGYNIKVGPSWYRTAPSQQVPILIGTRDAMAQRTQTSTSTYENVLDIGYIFARTDLSGGEGLDWDPREISLVTDQADLDKIRYWDSSGIVTASPSRQGEQYRLRLAPALTPTTWVYADMRDLAASEEFIFLAADDVVYWFESWTAATPIGDSGTTIPSPITSMAAAPNGVVMVTAENGELYVKAADAATFTQIYSDAGAALLARGVWYVNGRFVFTTWDTVTNSQLRLAEWNGTAWLTTTILDTASSPFASVVESGPAIVAACGDGTVRTYTPEQDGSMDLLPRGRTTVPVGEVPILLGANAGLLLVMTTAETAATDTSFIRLYQSEVLDSRFDFTVGQLQLKRQWVGTSHEYNVTRNMAATRQTILFFVREYIKAVASESLWSFNLVTGGLTRLSTNTAVDLNAITYFDGGGGAIDFTGNRVLVQSPSKVVPSGYVIFPNVTFGLSTLISWAGVVVEASNLISGVPQVELYRSSNPQAILDPDDPTWTPLLRMSAPGFTNTETPMFNVQSRTMALMLRIYATEDSSRSPNVTRIGLRGIPTQRDLILQVPFDVSDMLSAPGRAPVRIPGLGDRLHTEVLSLVGQNFEVLILDPPLLFSGVVNNISEPTTFVSNRGSVTRYCVVEFRGGRSRITTVPAIGNAGMGLGLVGVASVGIGQTTEPEE